MQRRRPDSMSVAGDARTFCAGQVEAHGIARELRDLVDRRLVAGAAALLLQSFSVKRFLCRVLLLVARVCVVCVVEWRGVVRANRARRHMGPFPPLPSGTSSGET